LNFNKIGPKILHTKRIHYLPLKIEPLIIEIVQV